MMYKAQEVHLRWSDHAGDITCLSHGHSPNSVIALSTGELEYHSMANGGSTGVGVQVMLREVGSNLNLVIKSAMLASQLESS